MENQKKVSGYVFRVFIFMFIVPLLVLSTFSRYEVFGITSSNWKLLLSSLIASAILTAIFYYIYRQTGKEIVFFRKWKSRNGTAWQLLFATFIGSATGMATFSRFSGVTIQELTLWLTAIVIAVVITVVNLFMRPKQN